MNALFVCCAAPKVDFLFPSAYVYHLREVTGAGDIVLFSGHIRNCNKLRQILGMRLNTDCKLYAAAYEKWGDDADQLVVGDYVRA